MKASLYDETSDTLTDSFNWDFIPSGIGNCQIRFGAECTGGLYYMSRAVFQAYPSDGSLAMWDGRIIYIYIYIYINI